MLYVYHESREMHSTKLLKIHWLLKLLKSIILRIQLLIRVSEVHLKVQWPPREAPNLYTKELTELIFYYFFFKL